MHNPFDWQSLLDGIYSKFPEASPHPVIGISANYDDASSKLADGYYKSVLRAGGTPVIIPPLADADSILNTLDRIDGLLLSGGADFNPLLCGEEPCRLLGGINSERDVPELLLTRLAYNRQLPILGICRGIQTLAMALGGRVRQDISDTATVKHSQNARREEPTHSVTVDVGSQLFAATGGHERLFVNSFHHQAVGDAGSRFRVTARSSDGIIEAIESSEHKHILGVQWHPECLSDAASLGIFRWLVEKASLYRSAAALHDRIVTLDSHCDTPMFFHRGVDFGHRDSQILVDLHKMHDGRQDATIMVCYLPQPKNGETFSEKVEFSVGSPKEYADLIFDKIEAIAAAHSSHLAIARTPADLAANKSAGRKSIMLGIENGLAIEDSLDNLRHFAQRGIVYMTLCHNGDNDICDSARGSSTHGGVSDYGRKVIAEMNRLGVMVDLSHAAESSFYDALRLSSQPIVCSHSNCRALCDHPRNLTDDQMRVLAKSGGVMQITLYNGFLVESGQATIDDVMRHFRHAIDIMGIDHVGIGTDFDGDGGIPGLADSSELPNLTMRLLADGFSSDDIRKIWGGNFLRVMTQVQANRHEQ